MHLTGFAPVISCMRSRHVDWTPLQGRKWSARTESHRRPGLGKAAFWLLNHTRKIGVPSWILTDNLTLRTRPLCALSYGDKVVRASGNAPDPGTDLVRCGV